MPYTNIHTHLFTSANAPENFLSLFLPKPVAKAVDSITNTAPGAAVTASLIRRFGAAGKRYANFLSIGKSAYQRDVFEKLRKYYGDEQMRFVALSLYMEQMGAGSSRSGFQGQLQDLMVVKSMYPEELIVFMGIDPRWKSTGEELRDEVVKHFEMLLESRGKLYSPFAGLKLYPSTGYYIFDEKLFPLLEWAANNNVPLLSHCSYLGGIYNNHAPSIQQRLNPWIGYGIDKTYAEYCSDQGLQPPVYGRRRHLGRWLIGQNQNDNNRKACSYFLEPASYEPVLAYFQAQGTPLKLCLAHFGGAEQIEELKGMAKSDPLQAEPIGTKPMNWFSQIQDLMRRYPSLYTDVSFTLSNQKLHETLLELVATAPFGNRIMFGTDYYMTEKAGTEDLIYKAFRDSAIKFGGNGRQLWKRMADEAPNNFLRSAFYKPD